jgi:hypothetical protein
MAMTSSHVHVNMLAIILKFEVGFIRLISRIHKLFLKNQPNGQEIKQGMHREEKGMFGRKVFSIISKIPREDKVCQ